MATAPEELLLKYGGELDPSLFGTAETEGLLIGKLDFWLEKGNTVAASLTDPDAKDAAAVEYAYVQAYTAAIVVRVADPSSATLATGESQDFDGDQLAALEKLRDRHQAAFDRMVPTVQSGALRHTASRSRSFIPVW